jgi:hypothetical protein
MATERVQFIVFAPVQGRSDWRVGLLAGVSDNVWQTLSDFWMTFVAGTR